MRLTPSRIWLLLTVGWMSYAFIAAEQLLRWNIEAGISLVYFDALVYSMGGNLPWIPLSYALLWLARRWPLGRSAPIRSIIALAMGTLGTIVAMAAYVSLSNPFFEWYRELPPFLDVVDTSFRNNLLIDLLILAVGHGLLLYERGRQHDAQIAELQSRLTGARLEALTAQLNPHFLFNTLNSIAEMVHHDAEAADRMLVGLSALLRRSLYRTNEQETPLHEELELLAHYLDIERVRLGPRLQVEWDVAPDCTHAYVPILILQPLAENAIVHAISRRREPGRVCIRSRRDGHRLRLDIEDDGAPASPDPGHGIGMRNTQARLQCLYGDDFRLALVRETASGGARVTLELPFSRTPVLPTGEPMSQPLTAFPP